MRILAHISIGLLLIHNPVNAQVISQRVTPIDGTPNHGDWLIPAGVGVGGIVNQGLNAPMPFDHLNDDTENRHWVFSGGAKQCEIMRKRNGFGKLIRFEPGIKPGEGTCIFAGKQTSFGNDK
jgi:hypothetical protein